VVDYVGPDKRHLNLAWVGQVVPGRCSILGTCYIVYSRERRCPIFSWPSALFVQRCLVIRAAAGPALIWCNSGGRVRRATCRLPHFGRLANVETPLSDPAVQGTRAPEPAPVQPVDRVASGDTLSCMLHPFS
jgi:hypothetical protein